MSINSKHLIEPNHIIELEKIFENKQDAVHICAEINVDPVFIEKVKAKLIEIGFKNVLIDRFKEYE